MDYWGVDINDDSAEAWAERNRRFGEHIQPLVDAFERAVENCKRAAAKEDEEIAQLEGAWRLPTNRQH